MQARHADRQRRRSRRRAIPTTSSSPTIRPNDLEPLAGAGLDQGVERLSRRRGLSVAGARRGAPRGSSAVYVGVSVHADAAGTGLLSNIVAVPLAPRPRRLPAPDG